MKADQPILESELRDALRAYLTVRRGASEHVLEELIVERGSSRVDFAAIGEYLEAFELKSDLDSFARMRGQIHAYNRSFERITLVAGEKYIVAGEQILPTWWGLIRASRRDDGGIALGVVRRATVNPLQELHSVASLLGEQEAISLLSSEAIAVGKRQSRFHLHDLIATSVPDGRLQLLVKSCLAMRPATPSRL